MRIRYRVRRAALLGALARELPDAPDTGSVGIAAGTFVLVRLPAGVQESAVVSAAAQLGVAVEGLEGDRPALVLGYANLPEPSIERGVALLGQAVAGAG
jgi:DNA-binding transcriptional MocR family regulator